MRIGRSRRLLDRIFILAAGVMLATSLAPHRAAAADTEELLYFFCAEGGKNCTDGDTLYAGLIMDKSRNLHGTTIGGGANSGNGTVFEVKP